MNASVLWDTVSRAKIEWNEAAGRVAFYLARDAGFYIITTIAAIAEKNFSD